MPTPARRHLRRIFAWKWLRGDYASWTAARAASCGYDDDEILARGLKAARAVRDGHAAWDRDGVTFASPRVHVPLLAALRQIAASAGGRLDVVDFGGGLGSTWRQHRSWLAEFGAVRWRVVEQPAVVIAGQREFAGDGLDFFPSLEEACAAGAPSTILFSSVLPYLERPRAILAEAAARRFNHIIVDRTGFIGRGRDRLTVQHVPPSIGAASYPCWLFDRHSFFASLAADYSLVDEWTVEELDGRHDYRGCHFQRLNRASR